MFRVIDSHAPEDGTRKPYLAVGVDPFRRNIGTLIDARAAGEHAAGVRTSMALIPPPDIPNTALV